VTIAASSPAHQFFTIFGAVLAGVGLIFLLVGWIIRRTARHLRGPAERAVGKIVGSRRRHIDRALRPERPGILILLAGR
jgi:hypothetical protein